MYVDRPLKERQKLAEARLELKARIAKGEGGLTIQDHKVVKTQRWINHTRPQGGEIPRPLGNPRPTLHSKWRPITAELIFAMLNAGSLLNKTEELADIAR